MVSSRSLASPARFVREGRATVNGQNLSYRVVSEDNMVESGGRLIGSVFSYSYFRTDAENIAERPVIFAWNGGPGASCVWLHMGFMGLIRARFREDGFPSPVPPYEWEDNPNCLLDAYDVVLMEPIESGFSRIADAEAAATVFSADGDAMTFSAAIRGWLTRYDR